MSWLGKFTSSTKAQKSKSEKIPKQFRDFPPAFQDDNLRIAIRDILVHTFKFQHCEKKIEIKKSHDLNPELVSHMWKRVDKGWSAEKEPVECERRLGWYRPGSSSMSGLIYLWNIKGVRMEDHRLSLQCERNSQNYLLAFPVDFLGFFAALFWLLAPILTTLGLAVIRRFLLLWPGWPLFAGWADLNNWGFRMSVKAELFKKSRKIRK